MNPSESFDRDIQTAAGLRNEIRDLGHQVDSHKAGTAGALGGGVFLLLLALGGAYDLITHNSSIRSAIGMSEPAFRWLVFAIGLAAGTLILTGLFRQVRRDLDREARLTVMEQELARLESETAGQHTESSLAARDAILRHAGENPRE